ncbi:MAG TPA: MlaD family protein [Solirubrobacteraceae bacterium]|jgi:virulence factor Mce-like protein|nr:MlaD family protein [Solirubrobacteraceae bacterium]
MDRRRRNSLAASPLLIGAVTTLIVVVAVFLSYNANNGLPFVPTYNIKVALPEASGLQVSNQVRIAGTRVGVVSSMSPRQNPRTGKVTAIADLKLEKSVEKLPADTKAIVQSVSAIGLKYLELEKGTSAQKLNAGATIPTSQTREPVNIEELFNMFDKHTRQAIKVNTNNFGDGLAGRGLGLNKTIAELRPVVNHAIPVLANLASPQTDFRGFFKGLLRSAEESAPVANQLGAQYVYLDKFFTAWAGVSKQLEEATAEGPASLEQSIHSLPAEAPLINNATEFMRLLRPSAADLVTVAPPLAHGFAEGKTNLAAATQLNSALAESAEALAKFGNNPVINLAFEDFTHTVEIGNPVLEGVAPSQAKCNYWTLAFRNVASLESESIGVGTVARAGVMLAPSGPNNEGFPSSAPANGGSTERAGGKGGAIIDNNHLHVNPYPNVSAPGQKQVCEAGKQRFIPGQAVLGNVNSVESGTEFTGRGTDLYGEPYPASTLEALGIKTAKKKGKKK